MIGLSNFDDQRLLTDSQVLERDRRSSGQSSWNLDLGGVAQIEDTQVFSTQKILVFPVEDVVSAENFTAWSYSIETASGYGYIIRAMSPLSDVESEYQGRIDELVECAGEEGTQMNQSSLSDIRSFVTTLVRAGKVGIFLLENGHFRAIQKRAIDDQVGIEFLGANMIKMTIIRRDPESKRMIADSRTLELPWAAASFLKRQFLF